MISTKQSEHSTCSYILVWNIENINEVSDGQFINVCYGKAPVYIPDGLGVHKPNDFLLQECLMNEKNIANMDP